MTQIKNSTPKKPLIDVIITAFNQTVILFFGIILSWATTEDSINVLFYILPCFIIFMLFGISYNRKNPLFLKLVFAVTAIYYFVMSLFTYDFFIALLSMVTLSSLIIGFSYNKNREGNRRALIPSIIATIQILFIYNLSSNYIDIFLSIFKDKSIWSHYILMCSALFLAISILSNFIVLVWKRWWIMTIIMAAGMAISSIHLFEGNKSLAMQVPIVAVLVYLFGVLTTYFVDYLIKKSYSDDHPTELSINSNRRKKSMPYIILVSAIQTLIISWGCGYKSILAEELINVLLFTFTFAMPIILMIFFTMLLFNISCNENKPLIIKWLIVAIAIIYIATALTSNILDQLAYLLIIISSIMFAFSYVKFRGGGMKNYIFTLTPSLMTIIQASSLYYLTNHYDSLNSIFYHSWSMSTRRGITMFITISLISNLIIMSYNKRWLWLLISTIIIGMVIYSICFFCGDNHYARETPLVMTLIYAGGIAITYLIKLLLSKQTKETKPNF